MSTKLEMAALNSLLTGEPYCPACGGSNGWLGTSNAYFTCEDCKDSAVYCCGGFLHKCGHTWRKAEEASPFYRKSPTGDNGW